MLYSLRPQSIGLSTRKPNCGALAIEAEIADRAYLGEYWDYQVSPLGGAKPLRVSTGPDTIFELGRGSGWRSIPPPWYG